MNTAGRVMEANLDSINAQIDEAKAELPEFRRRIEGKIEPALERIRIIGEDLIRILESGLNPENVFNAVDKTLNVLIIGFIFLLIFISFRIFRGVCKRCKKCQ